MSFKNPEGQEGTYSSSSDGEPVGRTYWQKEFEILLKKSLKKGLVEKELVVNYPDHSSSIKLTASATKKGIIHRNRANHAELYVSIIGGDTKRTLNVTLSDAEQFAPEVPIENKGNMLLVKTMLIFQDEENVSRTIPIFEDPMKDFFEEPIMQALANVYNRPILHLKYLLGISRQLEYEKVHPNSGYQSVSYDNYGKVFYPQK